MLRVVEVSLVLVAVIVSIGLIMIMRMFMAMLVPMTRFVTLVFFVVMVMMLVTVLMLVIMPTSMFVFSFLCHFLNPRCSSPYPLLFTPYSLPFRRHPFHDLPLLVGHLHDRKTRVAHQIEIFQLGMSLHLAESHRLGQGSHGFDIDDQQLWVAL